MIYDYKQDPELSRNGNVYSFDDYLEHHGIAGQKWGVRHGPPYPLVNAAKTIHYNVGKMTDKTREAYRQHKERKQAYREQKQAVKIQKKEEKAANRAQKAEAKDKRNSNIAEAGPKKFVKSKQRISDMSSEELQARINRLKLEQEYKKYLNGDQQVQKKVDNGKKATDGILYQVGKELALGLTRTAVAVNNAKRIDKVNQAIEARNRHNELKKQLKKDRHEIDMTMRKAEAGSYGKEIGEQKAAFEKERMQREHAWDEARRENDERNAYNQYQGRHTQNRRRRSSYYTST